MNNVILCIIVAILSFILGQMYGRAKVYEKIKAVAEATSQLDLREWTVDHERMSRVFHWGTEALPGLRYYGIQAGPIQIGFWRKRFLM